jgi:hypothetical protein
MYYCNSSFLVLKTFIKIKNSFLRLSEVLIVVYKKILPSEFSKTSFIRDEIVTEIISLCDRDHRYQQNNKLISLRI